MQCKLHSAAIKTALKGNRLKATPARIKLLDVFEHAPKPLSVKEATGLIGKHTADTATLYRNIEAFKQAGILSEVHVSNKEAYFELARLPHHHHLVCESCGKIADVEISERVEVPRNILKKSKFAEVKRHSLEFFGVCARCDNK